MGKNDGPKTMVKSNVRNKALPSHTEIFFVGFFGFSSSDDSALLSSSSSDETFLVG